MVPPSRAKARSAATTPAGVTGAAAAVSIRAAPTARRIFLMLRSIGGLTVTPEAGFSPGQRDREEDAMAYKPFDLTGKVALVTGGNGGIGLGMVEALAQAGAKNVICGSKPDKNAAAVEKLK